MKPITLHPVSVLVGAALVGLSFVLSGATQTPGVTHHPRTEVVGQVPAAWWTDVYLSTSIDGTLLNTYTVPPDGNFVVTLWQGSQSGIVFANGQGISGKLQAVDVYLFSYNGYTPDRNGTRVVLPPGTFLTASVSGSAYLWGYLEPVR